MPVRGFRSFDEAARALPPAPDAATGVRTCLFLTRLDAATRLGIRLTKPGLEAFRTVEEAEAARERYARDQLRRALG